MAAGLTDHVWELEELVALLDWKSNIRLVPNGPDPNRPRWRPKNPSELEADRRRQYFRRLNPIQPAIIGCIFLAIFVLTSGNTQVVKATITGSIVGNSLLAEVRGSIEEALWSAVRAIGQLEFRAHDGQRGAQLVAGVGHESSLPLVRAFDRGQHGVEASAEPGEFIIALDRDRA